MSYSIIIPSRSADNLRECVTNLGDDYKRIIVIDDDETGAVDRLCAKGGLATIRGEKPFCYARNVNLGIAACGKNDVVLLNDDALLESKSLGLLSHPAYGIASAAVRGLAHPIHRAGFTGWRDAARAVPFVCVYIRRAVFDAIGLLDERFTGEIGGEEVYGGEDDDFCFRARMAGFKIGVYGGCVVDHGTLPSTFRPGNGSRSIRATRKRFREIHGFEMGTR